MKKAIVLAAFGSRHESSVASLAHITERVRRAHPDTPVCLAYTSPTIRGHMAQAGEAVESVPDALNRLLGEGFTHAVVQSLHLIPGAEFHGLLELANDLVLKKGGFSRVEVGFPLVAGEAGVDRVVDAVLAEIMAETMAETLKGRDERDAVLFMGHGTKHDGNVYYDCLHQAFQARDSAVHMGAMEAEPGIDAIIERFTDLGVKRAFLLPFLFGAGWHAARDMVGEGETSWKSRLEEAGIECVAVLKGAGEYDSLVDIWLTHLDDAMRRLSRC